MSMIDKKVSGLCCILLLPVLVCAGTAPQFTVKADAAGKFWFVAPDGKQFLSIGLNNINPIPRWPREGTDYYNPVPTQFGGDFNAWKTHVLALLQENGFNTLGAWSDGRLHDGPMYGTICLYVAAHAQDRCLDALRPGFEDRVMQNIQIILADSPYTDNVFGIFLDNEMPWYGHAPWGDIPNSTLLEAALALAQDDGARLAAIEFIKKRYALPDQLAKAWGKPLSDWSDLTGDYARSCINDTVRKDRADFIGLAAESFYATSARVVRQVLPGKLILGTRFAENAPQPVIEACGRHCDVISFNHYTRTPAADTDLLARYWIWGGHKPLMVTEYSWRGKENSSGNPNSGGAGAVVNTQTERAANYSRYVEDLLSYPMVIGAHWFEFCDQSPQGRFDGENSNYGIVDIHNRPYVELLAAMKQTNSQIADLHAKSEKKAPDALPKPRPVVFDPGQYPGRPASIDLLNVPTVRGQEVYQASDANLALKKANDSLSIDFDSGKQWGCGVIFFGPASFKNPAGPQNSTDLSGYSQIELDAQVDSGVVFDLFMDEAGVDAPNSPAYDRSGGDDGEAFVLRGLQGDGTRRLYRLELKDLQLRTDYGNQKGLRKVDVNSMRGVSLFFGGGQGQKQAKVYALKLVR
ncbi:MAG: hypothetical protein LLF76_10705 [Planctomycetaceae bacterium]|nr:hypothetical protein [Planctomycetaceae bacterium]